MPEILEVEQYRRAAESVVGRVIGRVDVRDHWYVKGAASAAAIRRAATGTRVTAARRHGKLLLLDLAGGPVLGLRFGMTGRLVVDGRSPVDGLEYGSTRTEAGWNRFALGFRDGGGLEVNDPRRLGGVELDPDESALGPDALHVTLTELRAVVAGSGAPLKARLLDQSRLAGVGNLLADEILWRAGLDPARPARSLSTAEAARLHRRLRATIDLLAERGGSHTGDLQAERHRLGVCPRDGAPLQRRTVGGRTTYSCPRHQR